MKPCLITAALICWAGTHLMADPKLEQSNLWVAGKDGYHTYRIPSLIVTTRGTVLTFCEARKNSGSDHGDIDLAMRRSNDGGRTWGPMSIISGQGRQWLQ